MIGKRNGKEAVVLTLLEKVNRKYLAFKIPEKTSAAVLQEISELKDYCGNKFKDVFKTITTDNGTEFANLSEAEQYGTYVYYAHPYTSCERGQNKRHNRMLRHYLPKGKSIEKYTAEQIIYFADQINSRPRKILGYQTADYLFEVFLDDVYAL